MSDQTAPYKVGEHPTQEEMDQLTHEFTRAMRACRRRVQERIDQQTSVHSIPDEPGGIDCETKPMWRNT